jgi:hypothetical protein
VDGVNRPAGGFLLLAAVVERLEGYSAAFNGHGSAW